MREGISEEALRQFREHFVNSPYIGRAQLYNKEDTGLGHHRFFYLGYYDLFGVEMPASGRKHGVEFQIWPLAWVKKHLPRINKLVADALAGKYIHIRHNIELKKRAIESGQQFFTKPKHYKAPLALAKADRLPMRGRHKRKRKALKI